MWSATLEPVVQFSFSRRIDKDRLQCTFRSQALATEIYQHEYDHVAYFNNKIGSTVPIPSKPSVHSTSKMHQCWPVNAVVFAHGSSVEPRAWQLPVSPLLPGYASTEAARHICLFCMRSLSSLAMLQYIFAMSTCRALASTTSACQ